jgi:hypothetical protein
MEYHRKMEELEAKRKEIIRSNGAIEDIITNLSKPTNVIVFKNWIKTINTILQLEIVYSNFFKDEEKIKTLQQELMERVDQKRQFELDQLKESIKMEEEEEVKRLKNLKMVRE